jgi:ribokinase
MRKDAGFDVLGIGCNAVDHLCLMDRFPEEDQKTLVESIQVQGGGNVATALVAVARLGGKAVFHAVVANDDNRERILADFARQGVNTEHCIMKKGRNPLALILINRSNGTRTIMYTKQDVPSFMPDELDESLLGKTKVLLIDLYYPEVSLRSAQEARKAGIPVVIDAEKPSPLALEVLKHCSHVIASTGFARHYTGLGEDADDERLLHGFAGLIESPFVCITLGENGALAFERERNRTFHQTAYQVKTVDTTGAGDVFHGVFAYFLSRGCSNAEALRHAAACAAMKCRTIGGRRGIPPMNELQAFLKEQSALSPGPRQ